MEPERIAAQAVRRKQESGETVVLIDARSVEAWEEATLQIPGSIRVPPDDAEQHLHAIPHGHLVVSYCT